MKKELIRLSKAVLSPGAWQRVKNTADKVLLWSRADLLFYYGKDSARNALGDIGWADDFCRELIDIFDPSSVIDFGCGIGILLSGFERKGRDILGVDGSPSGKRYALIDKKNFIKFDLRRKFVINRKFDLCICMEVAEHIEEKYSDILVGSLTRASSRVLFSAAPPDQPADYHFNLKPQEWWVKKFAKFGFEFNAPLTSDLRGRIKNFPKIPWYYSRNAMIFEQRGI